MPRKPTRRLRFATSADPSTRVEPTGQMLIDGFPPEFRPPAQWDNYFRNLVGAWVDFFLGHSFNDWTRSDISSPPFGFGPTFIDGDNTTTDTVDVPATRFVMMGAEDNGSAAAKMHVYVSKTGTGWTEVTNLASDLIGNQRGLKFVNSSASAGIWFIWTDTHLMYTEQDEGGNTSSAICEGGSNWSNASVSGVMALDKKTGAAQYLAIIDDGTFKKSVNGGSWSTATTDGSPGGAGLDLVWSGTAFVSVNDAGEIWTTQAIADDLELVGAIDAQTWRLAAGDGKVVAYRDNGANVVITYSEDDGVSWSEEILMRPGDLQPPRNLTQLKWIDGTWVATLRRVPYVWVSNDLRLWERTRLPYPQISLANYLAHTYGADGVTYANGSVVILGLSGSINYTSTHARDEAAGDPESFLLPQPLSDAAYFRGKPLKDGVTPADKEGWFWDAGEQKYKLSAFGLNPVDTFQKSFDFSGGLHDYTGDANWAPSAFPDAPTNLSTSAILGDDVTVPHFYAANRASYAVSGLIRSTTPGLRVKFHSGTETWPATATGGQIVMIPLPATTRFTVEFTIRMVGSPLASGNKLRFYVGRNAADSALTQGVPTSMLDMSVITTSSTAANEIATIWGNAYTNNSVNAWIAGGIFRRHYKIVRDGPNLAVYGGAVGATTATTLIHGRSNASKGNSREDQVLCMAVAASSTANSLYIEMSDLSYSGFRPGLFVGA